MSEKGAFRFSGPVSRHPYRTLWRHMVSLLGFSLLVGILGAFLAVLVVDAIFWLGDQMVLYVDRRTGGFNIAIFLVPVAGGLAVGWLLLGMSNREALNVADIIASAQTRETDTPWRDGALNTLAAIVGIGSGASVGHYGPLANMGAVLGNQLGRWFRYDPVLGIACGVAAVISTAFSAPIAAVLFVHEVILRHYSLRVFAPTTVASSTGYFIEHHLLGRPPLFVVQAERSLFVPEVLAFAVIGLVCAVVAVVFMRLVILGAGLAAKSRLPNWLRPAVAGMGVGLVGQWAPEVLGISNAVLASIIDGDPFSFWYLGLLLVAKILATALCIGFGFAGGAFSPSLLIGVLTGALLGQMAGVVLGDHASAPAFYAVCGMAALASAVIGGPLTAVLIVFELTRNYDLTIAAMISVVICHVVTYRLFGRSLYDRQLSLTGCDLSQGRVKLLLERETVASHMTPDAVTVRADQPLEEARDVMIHAGRPECHVLDDRWRYCGRLGLFHILRVEKERGFVDQTAGSQVDVESLRLRPEQTLWDALDRMQAGVGDSVAVVDPDGNFLGVVYESSLVTAYFGAISTIRTEEHAA